VRKDPFEETLSKIKSPIKRAWLRMAMDHGRLHDSFCEIRHGSEAHKAWIAYMRSIGLNLWTFGLIAPETGGSRETTWTAPTEWPTDLPRFEPQDKRA